MKIILFLLIIVVIYLLATRIKIVHSNTLSNEEKKELDDRNKIRSMLMSNHIRCTTPKSLEKFGQIDSEEYSINSDSARNTSSKNNTMLIEKNKQLSVPKESANKLLDMIRSEFLDTQYFFNMASQPSTTRCPNKNTIKKDKKYIKHIENNIKEWNNFLSASCNDNQSSNTKPIDVIEIKPISIEETNDEFIVIANAKLFYLYKTLHLQLTYYGKIERTDDFLNGGTDTYILQLTNIKPISKNDFSQSIIAANNYTGPFITMDEQMAYVNKIKEMHENEEEYY